MNWRRQLAWFLSDALRADIAADYENRNEKIIQAVSLAMLGGLKAGFRIDPAEPSWPVAFIELPAGQVSWHLPQFPDEWDGHTTDQKNERVRQFIADALD